METERESVGVVHGWLLYGFCKHFHAYYNALLHCMVWRPQWLLVMAWLVVCLRCLHEACLLLDRVSRKFGVRTAKLLFVHYYRLPRSHPGQ